MNSHPTLADFEAFARGELATPEVRQLVGHLMTSCIDCRTLASSVFRLHGQAGPTPPAPPERGEGRREEAAIGRAFATARAMAVRAAVARECPHDRRRVRRSHGIEAVERLLERAWSLRYDDPPGMIRLAERAVREALQLAADEHGEKQVADCRARAYGVLGNAYRIADRLEEATGALGIAEGLRRLGTDDESLLAWLSSFRASLHAARRECDVAISLIRRVFEIHLRRGERQLAGRALISQAVFTCCAGQPEEAARLCDAGLELIDREAEPGLHFIALHNKLSFLVEGDRIDEAFRGLREVRALWPSDSLNQLRLAWLEGRIQAGRGDLEGGREVLAAVRGEFERRQQLYVGAVCALDLAAIELKLLRSEEAQRTIVGALQVFTSLRIPREALAATVLLHQAVEQGAVCVALLERVSDRLRKAAPQ